MLQDFFFGYSAGVSWRDRLRLMYHWLSPRFLGYRDAPPKPVFTHFHGERPIYLRPFSTDVRVLRHVFGNRAYCLPKKLTGEVLSIVDLGANVGISTLYFSERYPNACILAVEPDSSSYACLQCNVDTITENARIRTTQVCVSDRIGTVRFDTTGSSWSRSIVEHGGVEVRSQTVTEIMNEYDLETVDILKMDIEGAEKLAFQSANRWLNRVAWLIVEIHFSAMSLADLTEVIAPHGRSAFLKTKDSSGQWIKLTKELYSRIETTVPSVDLVIPPIKVTTLLTKR